MKDFISVLRIPECILVTVLVFISFKYSETPANNLIFLTMFLIVATTMLQNGWRDRFHDKAKGKNLFKKNPTLYVTLLTIFWLLCVFLASLLYTTSLLVCFIFIAMICVGLLYSEARRIPLLSISLVTITVASATLLPLGFGVYIKNILPLFLLSAFLMFGRENLHDIADEEFDKNYKKTIPVIFGDTFARICSSLALLLASCIGLFISLTLLPGVILIVTSLFWIQKDKKLKVVRNLVDVGFVLLAIGLMFA